MKDSKLRRIIGERKLLELIEIRTELAKIASKHSETRADFEAMWFDLLKSVGDLVCFDDRRFEKAKSLLSKLEPRNCKRVGYLIGQFRIQRDD